VIVDDGSRDDTLLRIERFQDDRVRVIRNEMAQGVSRARNLGIEKARGDWLAFCDDDDVWAPTKLASQVRAAQTAGAPWAYTGHVNITSDDRAIGGARPSPPDVVRRDLPRTNLIPGGGSNVLARADLVRRVGGFDRRLGILEDWDLWIRLAREASPAWVPEPLVGYRIHGTNSSQNIDRMVAEIEIIDARYSGPVDRVRFERHLARVSLRGGETRRAMRFSVRAAVRAVTAGNLRYVRAEFLPDVGAIVKTASPTFVSRPIAALRRSRRPARPDDWLLEAAGWLAELGPEWREQARIERRPDA
jgi:glycosyltransferase involved in cell wall biosynthesis